MTDILRRDDDLITRLTNCRRTSCQYDVCNLRNDDVDSPRQQTVKPEAALVTQAGSTASTRVTEWARIKQDELPHDSVGSLENGPMRSKFVNRPHPFLVRRVIRAVRNLGYFAKSTPCLFEPQSSLFLALELELRCPRSPRNPSVAIFWAMRDSNARLPGFAPRAL